MAVDTPARIAVLGAGPIGLEAALYARFLGYDVDVFERGAVAEHVRAWGHVQLFSPFGMMRSTLGLAALLAQDPGYTPPSDHQRLTGREWFEQYLLPLSQTDLLSDGIHTHATVIAVSRRDLLKTEHRASSRRSESPFRILMRDRNGSESSWEADIVIDATGVFGCSNWLGAGGAPAVGETSLRDRLEYRLPDLSGDRQSYYARVSTLVVGSGSSAATNVVALAAMASENRGTRVTWLTRGGPPGEPVPRIPDDPLTARDALSQAANLLVGRADGCVTHWPETTVSEISLADDRFVVQCSGRHAGTHVFDRVIANVGFRPDRRLYEELQVHECFATEGPTNLASLLQREPLDEEALESAGPQALMNPEPNFYILGAKSYGRNSNFLVSAGLTQIRQLFTVIGDRATLNLYEGIKNLLRK